jgi:hypothetical protein
MPRLAEQDVFATEAFDSFIVLERITATFVMYI